MATFVNNVHLLVVHVQDPELIIVLLVEDKIIYLIIHALHNVQQILIMSKDLVLYAIILVKLVL